MACARFVHASQLEKLAMAGGELGDWRVSVWCGSPDVEWKEGAELS